MIFVSEAYSAEKRGLNILFIGNSYTFYNNMPSLLEKISKSDKTSLYSIKTKAITKGGAKLINFGQSEGVLSVILGEKWDYVVLQDCSYCTIQNTSIKGFFDAVKNLSGFIKENGAYPILYSTWGRKDGSDYYSKSDIFRGNYDGMQEVVTRNYQKAAVRNEISVVHIGELWRQVLAQNINFDLYTADASHPSIYGSYLTALGFYSFITQKTPMNSSYRPLKISKKDATFLKESVLYNFKQNGIIK